MNAHCKTYHRGELGWQKQREIEFYHKLDGVPHFPDLIGVDDEGIYITDCGEQLTPKNISGVALNDVRQQFEDILIALKHAGIRHRDITINNVLWKDGTLYLVDFGWALWDGEDDTPDPVPDVMKEGFAVPDREQVQRLVEGLERWL